MGALQQLKPQLFSICTAGFESVTVGLPFREAGYTLGGSLAGSELYLQQTCISLPSVWHVEHRSRRLQSPIVRRRARVMPLLDFGRSNAMTSEDICHMCGGHGE